jgi:hypothetical protein
MKILSDLLVSVTVTLLGTKFPLQASLLAKD